MARIRSVKPELRTSELVASWPFEVRYFWVLLWGYLDDKGRGLDIPKRIAGDCFPHDHKITAPKVDGWLDRMTRGFADEPGPVCRYMVDGRRYLHAVNWHEHQRINRPTPSRLPRCHVHEGLSEPLSDELTEPLPEPDGESLNGHAVPGAGEQGKLSVEEVETQESLPDGHDERPDVERLCERLQALIVANGSKATITAKWRTEARLLLDRDKRPVDEVMRLIEWCQRDQFWKSNVLSMPTFRKQYDKLRLQAERSPNLRAVSNGYQPWTNPTDQNAYDEELLP